MKRDTEDEINALPHDQLRLLFWQTVGWMAQQHKTEIDNAVGSALDEIKNVEEMMKNDKY